MGWITAGGRASGSRGLGQGWWEVECTWGRRGLGSECSGRERLGMWSSVDWIGVLLSFEHYIDKGRGTMHNSRRRRRKQRSTANKKCMWHVATQRITAFRNQHVQCDGTPQCLEQLQASTCMQAAIMRQNYHMPPRTTSTKPTTGSQIQLLSRQPDAE
jgi:hypothetical protein